ncbi:MAG TPA: peptidylprolyl isomerase [Bacteroidia bacterium]|jgi:cyclophilin family peptidyl-prolyl cis-trans isomerase
MNNKNLFPAFSLIVAVFLIFASFKPPGDGDAGHITVLMKTTYGNIRIRLYNETPLHRDNFVKLIKQHYFDSLLFHRVIQKFMIQGGDPESKKAIAGEVLGEGGPGYTVPAEIDRKLFHKKGVLAAARESDLDNPTKASSGSQFYIVQGKTYTDSLLKIQATRITKRTLYNYFVNLTENEKYLNLYKRYAKEEKADSMKYINDIFDAKVEKELPNVAQYKFSPEQIKAYTTIGGTPALDNTYTVFGEVYEGMEIIDMIAAQKTDGNARPLSDIRIISVSIIP